MTTTTTTAAPRQFSGTKSRGPLPRPIPLLASDGDGTARAGRPGLSARSSTKTGRAGDRNCGYFARENEPENAPRELITCEDRRTTPPSFCMLYTYAYMYARARARVGP